MGIETQLLTRIRRLFHAGAYYMTRHAREEMEADGLFEEDVIHAVTKCREGVTHRGPGRTNVRHELTGSALDGRRMTVVCRFDDRGGLRVITVWAVEEKG